MPPKIFRDPLYNYIAIERDTDKWLLDLLDTPEVQRLRRIHQLGVSHLTYPGAEHSRLSHCLGVVHLMQQALEHLGTLDRQVGRYRDPLLAAALLHDVGHGPFSHVFESCLGIDHETWSCDIILSPETKVNRILRGVDRHLPEIVVGLIKKDNQDYPCWAKHLLTSQLDVDRLDYLRRDSLFTGAGYGHFDWYRILHSFQLYGEMDADRDIIWIEKSALAIEEYVFARFYMYWNVYLHKTTRGFERIIEAMWARARNLYHNGTNVKLLRPILAFWKSKEPSPKQYLAIEECTFMSQIQAWAGHKDEALSDLARRFLFRDRFVAVDAPPTKNPLSETDLTEWEVALRTMVGRQSNYRPAKLYCLKDTLKSKYTEPYFPERETAEQAVDNAIRLIMPSRHGKEIPVEISTVQRRLKPVAKKPANRYRYYIPKQLEAKAIALRKEFE